MKGTELAVYGIPNQVKGSSTHELPNRKSPRHTYTGMLDEICIGLVT